MISSHCRCINCITPPYILKKLLESKDGRISAAALRTMLSTSRLRGERIVGSFVSSAAAIPGDGRRTVFDCANSTFTESATIERTEDGPASSDESVNRTYNALGLARKFYQDVFDRNSIDGRGMRLNAYVHFGPEFNNAFWFRGQLVFGDGDGVLFGDFTNSLDVIAHEYAHGVTEFTSALRYHKQSGALNESMSDVFGSLIKQWSREETADKADWLMGSDIFTPAIEADALRSLKAPGKAFNNDQFGRDPQPDHFDKFVNLPDTDEGDWGGVHINSGIPNKAFYLTAIGIGGPAWEAPGHIWYSALKAASETTDFQEFANLTHIAAVQLYGPQSEQKQAVVAAWKDVGIRIGGAQALAGTASRMRWQPAAKAANGSDDDDASAMMKMIEQLSGQLSKLTKEVAGLKSKH